MMFKKKSKDEMEDETSEKKEKKKKAKKPKLTPQEKAVKNKQKVEKQASAKVKKADAKVKKVEQAIKNKEKAAAKKLKDIEKKAANKIKAEEKKIENKEKKKEQKAVNKIKNQEKKAKQKSERMQRKAELAARSPLQKKIDRRLRMKKILAVLIVLLVLAGLVFAGIKFGPKLIKKMDLPQINISEFTDNIKSKIPFLNNEDSEEKQDEQAEQGDEENTNTSESEALQDDITLYISGSSVLNDFYSEALKQFLGLSKKELKEQCSIATTNDAYTNLINGDQQVIFSAFPTDRETKMAELAGVDLQPIPILNGGFVFFVNKDNPIKSLTVTQLYNIYSGTITNWKELGGKDEPILAYQRADNSGSQTGIYKHVIDSSEILKVSDEMKASNTKDIVKEISSNEGAIGYSYYYYLEKLKNSDDVKMIAVNAVKPSKKTIETAAYPLITHSYAIITTEEKTKSLKDVISSVDDHIDLLNASKTDETKEMTDDAVETQPLPLKLQFIEWILSDEGQKLAEEEGFIRHNN